MAAMLFEHLKTTLSGLALLTAATLCGDEIVGVDLDPALSSSLVAAAEPTPLQNAEKSHVIIKGVIVGPSSKAPNYDPKHSQGVTLEGLNLPGDANQLIDQLGQIAMWKPLSDSMIDDLKRAIVVYYREHDRPIVMVVVPEQDVTDGILQLGVIEGKVGNVVVKGQKHFSESRIRNNIHLKRGDPIDSDQLLTDVQWLNQNPFRQTNVVFSPGAKHGTTDVELITVDRYPVRVYAGGDNTGNPITGRTRLFVGLNEGNMFDLDHILSFQWTTSDDVHKFLSYTGSYSIPLPWRHTLSFFGGYSSVRPHIPGLKSIGWSAQASTRYKIPIYQTYGSFVQDLQFGYDFKETNNNLLFAGGSSAIETKIVQLGQFVGSYHLAYLEGRHILNFEWDAVLSPAQHWFGHQSTRDYHKLQPGSSPIYTYTTISVKDDLAFSANKLHRGWRLFYQGRAQLANKILLPSEQFSLGGYSTVRGYIERLVNYDNAACVNLELRTPVFYPWKIMTGKDIGDSFYFLAFVDYGYGWAHRQAKLHLRHLDPFSHTLLGVGPGLRYSVNRYFSARCDLGFPLTSVESNGWYPHIHFGLLASY
ncbi:MAG: ShlB/FhaC/HecB family hemolysin secretion/activation protein [Rhabdochlamydiaceae bacterium]